MPAKRRGRRRSPVPELTRTLEQLQQAKVLAPWDRYSKGFINHDYHVAQLFNSLKGVAKNPPWPSSPGT